MTALADAPALDKTALLGGCLRLPVRIDAERMAREIEALPAEVWGTTGGRVGVHRDAGALFVRGYAPAEGDKPIEDRPVLELLPYTREVITTTVGPDPLRCLFARLPAGKFVAEHADIGPYFTKTIRIHYPVISNPNVRMVCAGLSYLMRPGEVWGLNNSARHAVWNADPAQSRTHLICDYLLTPQLERLLAASERDLGRPDPETAMRVRSETVKLAAGG
jgi:hypothetical protein